MDAEATRRVRGLPGQRPINAGKLHPLEHEARRNLQLARRLGRRLDYQLRAAERAETAAGTDPGTVDLPDGWLVMFASYTDTVVKLLHENRMYLALTRGKGAAGTLDAGAESEELVDAVALMTEDELQTALRRRGAKDGAG